MYGGGRKPRSMSASVLLLFRLIRIDDQSGRENRAITFIVDR
jgi:hypothetical protein